ncbi:MAG TPA: nuclear transport factor 2 family protein [Mycobacterium sp.]|nr:nuclear transport factor 2 family protein [Mycobacterium sp.]
MDDVDAFVASVVPLLREEVIAMHNGQVGPRMALWSHHEPVSLFGAVLTQHGWSAIEPAFEWLATTFHGGESCDYEVLAAGASGDLGYIAGIEHSVVATSADGEPKRYQLRVTTVFRREDDAWKVVHRHGDPYDPASATVPPR